MALDLEKLFTRNLELNIFNNESEIILYQSSVGDVGCVVWDAALVLCKYLETKDFDQGKKLKGKNAIDLGAGTGAVGIMASVLGAATVITDLPPFVPLMEHNINANKKVISGSCLASTLEWGDEKTLETLKCQHFPHGPDYIFIADCVYYPESVKSLVDTILMLSHPHTTILCSYEERDTGNKPELQRQFFEMVGKHFHVTEIPISSQDPRFSSPDIHIMKFVLKSDIL